MAITYSMVNEPKLGVIKAILSSFPLRKLNEELEPCGLASGCFLSYKGAMLFLSVEHIYNNIEPGERWAIEEEYNPETARTPLHIIGECKKCPECIVLPEQKTVIEENEYVDFIYKRLNFVRRKIRNLRASHDSRRAGDNGVIQITSEENLYFEDDLNTLPDKNEEYTFAGNVKPSEKADQTVLLPDGTKQYTMEFVCYSGLKYVRTRDKFLEFETGMRIDEERLVGCSGSPILDSAGNLVSLAVQFRTKTKPIKKGLNYRGNKEIVVDGLDLQRYKVCLDDYLIRLSESQN